MYISKPLLNIKVYCMYNYTRLHSIRKYLPLSKKICKKKESDTFSRVLKGRSCLKNLSRCVFADKLDLFETKLSLIKAFITLYIDNCNLSQYKPISTALSYTKHIRLSLKEGMVDWLVGWLVGSLYGTLTLVGLINAKVKLFFFLQEVIWF